MDRSKKPTFPESLSHGEGFEFEIIDVGEARRVLDSESMSQFDVAATAPPGHWERVRRGKLPTDRALTGRAIDWLLALPPPLRPQNLSSQFPRITNALAEVWHEPHQCQAALDKLVCGDRRGRKGFPAAVHDELVALRNWTLVL